MTEAGICKFKGSYRLGQQEYCKFASKSLVLYTHTHTSFKLLRGKSQFGLPLEAEFYNLTAMNI